ncbi:MAG: hypothetical protein KAT70_00145 [Thermoplasmata archaeon]|nr:hypothetical protein [Thermoplasmata archaeon]
MDLEHRKREIALHLERARTHSARGLHHSALEELAMAETLLYPMDQSFAQERRDVFLSMMSTNGRLGNLNDAFSYYRKVLPETPDIEGSEELLRIHRAFGTMWWRLGFHFNATEEYSLALELAEKVGAPREIAPIELGFGSLLLELGKHGEAHNHLSRAISLLEEVEKDRDLQNLSSAFTDRGFNFELMGEYDRAIEDYETAIRLGEEAGNIEKIERALVNMARTLAITGDTKGASLLLERGSTCHSKVRSEDLYGGACLVKALICLATHEMKEAKEYYGEASNAFGKEMNTAHGGMVAYMWGRSLLKMGLLEEAERTLGDALTAFGDMGNETMLDATEKLLEKCKAGA